MLMMTERSYKTMSTRAYLGNTCDLLPHPFWNSLDH